MQLQLFPPAPVCESLTLNLSASSPSFHTELDFQIYLTLWVFFLANYFCKCLGKVRKWGFFRITSSGCCCISAAAWVWRNPLLSSYGHLIWSAGATEWVQWPERGSMNAAQIKCNCMNANIAIARRWLSKGYSNFAACIPHVVAKMSFTNSE